MSAALQRRTSPVRRAHRGAFPRHITHRNRPLYDRSKAATGYRTYPISISVCNAGALPSQHAAFRYQANAFARCTRADLLENYSVARKTAFSPTALTDRPLQIGLHRGRCLIYIVTIQAEPRFKA